MHRASTLFASLLLAAWPCRAHAQVTVIQLNDIYRIDAVDNGRAGGMGRAATIIDRTRKRGENVLVLHAGDFLSPSLESRYFGGKQMIDAMNFLQAKAPFIVVPGNHEYDASDPRILAEAIAASRFPWLAENLKLTTGTAASDQRIQTDTIVQIGGMRIGIFALTLLDDARSYAVVDTQYVPIAERRITALEQAGADVILGLTHLDISVDRAMARLRRAHPRFLWIVSGHEHYVFSDALTDSTALITNGESNARNIWRVRITPGASRSAVPGIAAELIALDTTVAIDPAYQTQIVKRYADELERMVPLLDQQIGVTAVPLDGREEIVRGGESNWANYLTDVMRGAYPDIPADIAVLNGGSIRIDDVVNGPIRWEHLQRTFGFPTRVALVWLRGADVRSLILEKSVSGEEGHGRFMQVSGVRFAFDRRKPPFARVTQVDVLRAGTWQPLDPQAVYVVAVPDYSYGGGDGYTFHNRALMSVPPGPDLRLMTFQALLDSLAKGKPIAPQVEGRIREIKD